MWGFIADLLKSELAKDGINIKSGGDNRFQGQSFNNPDDSSSKPATTPIVDENSDEEKRKRYGDYMY